MGLEHKLITGVRNGLAALAVCASTLVGGFLSPACYVDKKEDNLAGIECYIDNECAGGSICEENICVPAGPLSAVKIAEETKVIESPRSLQFVSADQSRVCLYAYSAQAQSLKEGDIIVTGIGERTPFGLLRKIVSLDVGGGDQLCGETVPASLEEAIEEGSLRAHVNFSPAYLQKVSPLRKGIEVRRLPLQGEGLEETMEIDFDRVDLYEGVVFLDGRMRLTLGMDLNVQYGFFSVRGLQYRVSGKEELDLTLRGEITREIERTLPPIEPLWFPPLAFAIGPVPVVVTPNLTIQFGLRAEGSLSTEVPVHQGVTAEFSLSYRNDQWTPEGRFSEQLTAGEPAFTSIGGSVEAYAKPRFSLKLYDVMGAFTAVKGSVGGDVEVIPDLSYRIYGGVDLSAGVLVEVFGRTLREYEGTLYEYRKNLIERLAGGSVRDAGGGEDAGITDTGVAGADIGYPRPDVDGGAVLDRFVAAGGTVTDTAHRHCWQRVSSERKFLHREAVAGDYCRLLDLDGRAWRMPSIHELLFLLEREPNEAGCYINSLFEGPCGIYWGSDGMHVNFLGEIDPFNLPDPDFFIRCVSDDLEM